jgi:hypothetical protein
LRIRHAARGPKNPQELVARPVNAAEEAKFWKIMPQEMTGEKQ